MLKKFDTGKTLSIDFKDIKAIEKIDKFKIRVVLKDGKTLTGSGDFEKIKEECIRNEVLNGR